MEGSEVFVGRRARYVKMCFAGLRTGVTAGGGRVARRVNRCCSEFVSAADVQRKTLFVSASGNEGVVVRRDWHDEAHDSLTRAGAQGCGRRGSC
jgi:hypothetical protein